MLTFSRRETILLAVPPLAFALMLCQNGGRHGPSHASAPDRGDFGPSDEGAVQAVAERLPPPLSGAPTLQRRTLRVTDPSGKPLAAKVRVAFSQDGFRRFETVDVEPGPDGRLPLDLDASAWVVVSVQAPGHVPRWQPPVTWGELRDSDLEFELAAALAVGGSSRWADGRPMSGVRLAFRPAWPPGEYAGQVASRLQIVDEEVTTDAAGRFSCASLRPGAYRVSFPDRPAWPPLMVPAEDLAKGTLALRASWNAPASR
jgi:hypothetical protein